MVARDTAVQIRVSGRRLEMKELSRRIMDREERMRRLACCDSEVACLHCPMRPENRHRSLKELAEAATTNWR